MGILKKRKEAAKRELAFEKENLWYFVPHYIRIAVLMFLVFVATFYGTSYNMCEDMGGYLTGSSIVMPKCEPIPVSSNKLISPDSSYFLLNYSNLTEKYK